MKVYLWRCPTFIICVMKMATCMNCLLVVVLYSAKDICSQTVSLTADKPLPVMEGDVLLFTCTITDTPMIVLYNSTLTGTIAYWITTNGKCDQLQIANRTMYNASCDSKNSKFYLEILSVYTSFHHSVITCEARYHTMESIHDSFLIDVQRKGFPSNVTPIVNFSQECDSAVNGRTILIIIIVLLTVIQFCECVIFVIMYRKGNIVFNLKKRQVKAYEDINRTRTDGQTYNTECSGQEQRNYVQIYEDVRF